MNNQVRSRQQSVNPSQKSYGMQPSQLNHQHQQQHYQSSQSHQQQQQNQRFPHPSNFLQPPPPPPATLRPMTLVQKIYAQIKNVDNVNKQLLTISEMIRQTSSSIQSKNINNPAIIQKIQNDFHAALNSLIQNIMEFYTEIDAKIKNLAFFVNSEFSKKTNTITQNQINTMIQQTTDAKYQMLSQRIMGLQVSLKETQQNQKKLIQVIQTLMQKYQVSDQPTLIRDSPSLQNQFKRNRIATTNPVSSHQQYPAKQSPRPPKPTSHTASYIKPENKNKSIYQNLYAIEESRVHEAQAFGQPNYQQQQHQQSQVQLHPQQEQPQHFRLRQIQQDSNQVYIKKLYSKNPLSLYQMQSKRSLKTQGPQLSQSMQKQQRSTASQASIQDDKTHRLNFMMGRLNT